MHAPALRRILRNEDVSRERRSEFRRIRSAVWVLSSDVLGGGLPAALYIDWVDGNMAVDSWAARP